MYIDSKLIKDCIDGKRDAQSRLYGQYSKAMYNVCLRMMGDRDAAEDVMQISFIEVFTKMHTYTFESTIGAWIKRVVVNKCIDTLRKRRIRFEEVGSAVEDIPDIDSEDHELDVSEIKRVINLLPEGYKVIFNLYCVEGYDHQEISEILSISVSTSKSQYHRAKNKIYEMLKHGGSARFYN